MKKYALLVGVETYRDSAFSRLRFARADATALAERLRDRCGFDHIRLLADEAGDDEPLLVNIATALRDISAELTPEDLFLFFFAGHGLEKDGHGYLLARETIHAFPEHSSLSLELLRKTFAYLNAGKRNVLLDACRNSPEIGRDEASNPMGEVISRDIVAAAQSHLGTCTTTALFTACRSGQRAFEWPAKGHGVFTQCLLEGLDGGAWSGGELEFSQLARYTVDRVRAWGAVTPGRSSQQEPWYEQFGEPGPIVLKVGQPGSGRAYSSSLVEPHTSIPAFLWWVVIEGQERGPLAQSVIQDGIFNGTIRRDTPHFVSPILPCGNPGGPLVATGGGRAADLDEASVPLCKGQAYLRVSLSARGRGGNLLAPLRDSGGLWKVSARTGPTSASSGEPVHVRAVGLPVATRDYPAGRRRAPTVCQLAVPAIHLQSAALIQFRAPVPQYARPYPSRGLHSRMPSVKQRSDPGARYSLPAGVCPALFDPPPEPA